MEAIISNFRSGMKTRHTTQMIVIISGIDSREKVSTIMGKTLVWTSPAKSEIKGTIIAPHGNKVAVRAKFERGMPGQSV